jgi:hypothetical protein
VSQARVSRCTISSISERKRGEEYIQRRPTDLELRDFPRLPDVRKRRTDLDRQFV